MTETGCYARRKHGFIQFMLCQWSNWHHTSPVTPVVSHLYFSCPVSPLFMHWKLKGAADHCAVGCGSRRSNIVSTDFFNAIPWQNQMCNGCQGRRNGQIGRLFTKVMMNKTYLFMRRGNPHSSLTTALYYVYCFLHKLNSRVTTPAQTGAFFRNEGGNNPPTLPRMEEVLQGVTPPFDEEVAWGRGGTLFCSQQLDGNVFKPDLRQLCSYDGA